MSKLTIIEYPYCDTQWHINTDINRFKVHSSVKKFTQRREVDEYHLCGVYHKAEMPFEIKTVTYDEQLNENPFHILPQQFFQLTYDALKNQHKVLVAGSYCMFAPAVIGGIQQAYPTSTIGLIWLDAHSDNHIAETSNKKIVKINGIPFSTILGQTYHQWAKEHCGMISPLEVSNVLFSDGHLISIDNPENIQMLYEANVHFLNQTDFQNTAIFTESVNKIASKVDKLFLMIDIDILDEKYIPSYPIPVPNGNTIEKVMENIKIVMKTNKVCTFMVSCSSFEVNKDGKDTTYLNAMKLIASGLENWR